jgi:hypothetical protein
VDSISGAASDSVSLISAPHFGQFIVGSAINLSLSRSSALFACLCVARRQAVKFFFSNVWKFTHQLFPMLGNPLCLCALCGSSFFNV